MKALLFLLLAILGSTAANGQTRKFALVIGNNNYESLPTLKNAINDAKLVGESLRQSGFDVSVIVDANFDAMRQAIVVTRENVKRAQAAAQVVVYFAGHGIESKGINYLMPTSARVQSADDLEFYGIRADTLVEQISRDNGSIAVVILDACRTNPVGRGGGGLARIDAPAGTFIGFATSPGRTASDGDGSNGPYAIALAKNIGLYSGPVEILFRRVRNDVLAATNQSQLPWDSSSLTGQDFCLQPTCDYDAKLDFTETPLSYLLRKGIDAKEIKSAYIATMRKGFEERSATLEKWLSPGLRKQEERAAASGKPRRGMWHVLENLHVGSQHVDVVLVRDSGSSINRPGHIEAINFQAPDALLDNAKIEALVKNSAN